VVRAIERGGSRQGLWSAIEESGFCDALVPEVSGGAGLGLRDTFAAMEICGRSALPFPLAQTMVARAQLARTALPAFGALAIASGPLGDGLALAVSYGAVADAVLVQHDGVLVLLDARQAERELLEYASVDARLTWTAAALDSPVARVSTSIDLRAVEACLLAVQMAGAMQQVLKVTLQHANDRVQFGRSIGKFQAVQHQLSIMAEEVIAATMAAQMACNTDNNVAPVLACAVAKARAGEAALIVARVAHAVHGAIGITEECNLQLLTRRLLSWRVSAGSEAYWNEEIGRALVSSDCETVPEFVRGQLCPIAT
jgi:acyl-CoA dehydrogenase